MKKCKFCAEEIQDEAILCRYCGKKQKPPKEELGEYIDKSITNERWFNIFIGWTANIFIVAPIVVMLGTSVEKGIEIPIIYPLYEFIFSILGVSIKTKNAFLVSFIFTGIGAYIWTKGYNYREKMLDKNK